MIFNVNSNEIEVANEDLTAAIETGSMDLALEGVTIRTEADEATYKTNIRQEGIVTGQEIGRKQVLTGFGLDGEGLHKSESTAIEALNTYVSNKVGTALTEAKIKPDEKVAALESDKKQLVANMQSLQGEFDTFKTQTSKREQGVKRTNTLSGLIPDNTLNAKDITLTILESRVQTAFDENGNMYGVGADGQPMKNATTLELLPMKDVVGKFFNDNPSLLKASGGGAGGSDSGGGNGKQSMDDFIKEQQEAGNAPNGEEFNRIMGERMKNKTLDLG